MKSYLIKISFFLVPILAVVIFLELYIRIQPNDYSYKNEYLTTNAKDIETLIVGSSHSFYGIDPQYFSMNTFSAAHVAQSLKWDYFIFDKFKAEMSSLKNVVIPISYFSLFYDMEGGDADWRIKDYKIYYDAQEPSWKYNFEIFNRKIAPLLIHAYKLFVEEDKGINCTELGFGQRTALVDVDMETSGITAAKVHTVENYDAFSSNLEILEKFINECKQMDVTVFLVVLPAWETYRENLDADQLIATESYCFELSHKFKNTYYYSFLDDRRFKIEDFANADHLNNNGAEKISRILNTIITFK
ncbi:MAG: hypothetical protein PF638_00340 [Candidatus Delongbacteria bacterium]|jgi:hypothetical protein|nr:hypothetical protein [Candidatus Delongbacteria bacterium]